MIEDQILEEPELENQTKFEHYVQATGEIVEEFRDVLAATHRIVVNPRRRPAIIRKSR